MNKFVQSIAVLSLASSLSVSTSLNAEPRIQVKGLFSNRAILEINGEDRLVKAGEQTPEGVVLISSNSKVAVIKVNGVKKTLSLSQQIASEFSEAPGKVVKIPQSPDSHYRVDGSINGKSVKMVVDTGATAVAMNAKDAERLGIDYLNGVVGKTSTAGGLVDTYLVDLNRVTIGDISVYNIKAVVIPGEFPQQILLGNTFLNHVVMEQEAGALILRSKY